VREVLARPEIWLRCGLLVAFVTGLFVIMSGWSPAFPYRTRMAPLRNMHARTEFAAIDADATSHARLQAREKFPCYYLNKPRPLDEIRQAVIDDLFKVKQLSYAELSSGNFWPRFLADDPITNLPVPAENSQKEFERLKTALLKDEKLAITTKAIENAFSEIRRYGLLRNLEHELGNGSMQEIQVYLNTIEDTVTVNVSKVRMAETLDDLRKNLLEEFSRNANLIHEPALVAERVFQWLKPRLPVTLSWDAENSRIGQRKAAAAVAVKLKQYQPGDPLEKAGYGGFDEPVIRAAEPLNEDDIRLLAAEHQAFANSQTVGQRIFRSASFYGMFFALAGLMGGYLYFRERHLLLDLRHFVSLLALVSVTIATAWLVSTDVNWRAEIIPITMFAMLISIAYLTELSLILSTMAALTYAVLHGYGLGEFVILTGAASIAALLSGTIRSRTKLVYVGLTIAAGVLPTVVGVQYLLGQPLGRALMVDAGWFAANAALAGLFMTALLPFLERGFDLPTDISLLELSDANHLLLKQLVQAAPGTYNHSINVASIAEAAAEAIGSNGLLCRVGAYFHDIGKLRKPEYFIENQAGGKNKHDDLNPAMSTLVIIAHVKEGSEIARQYSLPKRIIDLIEQHHGTTLVTYFYHRAARQSAESGSSGDVPEVNYRYPGPKPQTREAVVMMLADAVESASRTLREPTPGRIENLVNEIAKSRLDDGQFDECEITLQQLHVIQSSLIKSLNAMYHGRVKYPDQQTA
jgi:hypothetical protein